MLDASVGERLATPDQLGDSSRGATSERHGACVREDLDSPTLYRRVAR